MDLKDILPSKFKPSGDYRKIMAMVENEIFEEDLHKKRDIKEEVEKLSDIAVNYLVQLYENSDKFNKESIYFDSNNDKNLINYIDNLLAFIKIKASKNEWSDVIKHGLNSLLILSSQNKIVAMYLIEYDVLKKIMDQVHSKPELMEICLDIIFKISKIYEQTMDWIGNFHQFAMLILNQFKSTSDLVLNNLLKILQLAVHNIKIKNDKSYWLTHFKEYGSFANNITAIFEMHFYEKLTITATELIKDIVKTKLPNQRTLLEELFKISELIPVLMRSCTQLLIAKQKYNSPINLEYIYNWLTIMAIVKSHLYIIFERNEEKEKYLFIKILIVILHPYQEENFSFVGREIKQDLHVIFKCVCLLSYIHRYFYIPILVNHFLMKITLKLHAEKTSYKDTKELIWKLLSELDDFWIYSIQCRKSESIIELMKLFKPVEYQYFIHLASYHSDIRNKLRVINCVLKKTVND